MLKSNIVCNANNDKIVCIKREYDENGNVVYAEKFDVNNADCNRFMIESKVPIECEKVGDEVSCKVRIPYHAWIPLICDKDGKCGFEMDKLDLRAAICDLYDAEKKKKGFNEFLAKNGIKVIFDKFLKHRTGKLLGWSCCDDAKELGYDPFGPHPVDTLLHEWAHCREQIAREEKGLPQLSDETGGWRPIGKFGGKLYYEPVGHELRAVKFVERIKRKSMSNNSNNNDIIPINL